MPNFTEWFVVDPEMNEAWHADCMTPEEAVKSVVENWQMAAPASARLLVFRADSARVFKPEQRWVAA